jgi:hypothetical protein
MGARREAWFKENGPCECGSWDNLELHHKNPEEKVTHRVWTWAEDRRLKELAKCVAVCVDCHDRLTLEWIRSTITHCPQGHAYTEDNLDPQTGKRKNDRKCKICRVERDRKARAEGRKK